MSGVIGADGTTTLSKRIEKVYRSMRVFASTKLIEAFAKSMAKGLFADEILYWPFDVRSEDAAVIIQLNDVLAPEGESA